MIFLFEKHYKEYNQQKMFNLINKLLASKMIIEDDIKTLFDQLPDLILPEKYIYRDNQQIIVGYFSSFVSYCTRKNLAEEINKY